MIPAENSWRGSTPERTYADAMPPAPRRNALRVVLIGATAPSPFLIFHPECVDCAVVRRHVDAAVRDSHTTKVSEGGHRLFARKEILARLRVEHMENRDGGFMHA